MTQSEDPVEKLKQALQEKLQQKKPKNTEPSRDQLLARGYCCKTGCQNCPWEFTGGQSGCTL